MPPYLKAAEGLSESVQVALTQTRKEQKSFTFKFKTTIELRQRQRSPLNSRLLVLNWKLVLREVVPLALKELEVQRDVVQA